MKKRLLSTAGIVGVTMVVLSGLLAGCGGGGEADDSAALMGKRWVAVQIAGSDAVLPADQGQASAVFMETAVSGSGTVNQYNAGYQTGAGNTISISAIATTEMAGPPEAMAQEAAYYAALESAATYAVTEDSLELLDNGGETVVAYEAVEPTALAGTEWQALAYNNGKGGLQSLAAESTITAVFADDGTLSGNASVNQYTTAYEASEDGAMSIDGPVGTTKMAGPEEFMTQEAAYLAALPQTTSYIIDGDQLWLRGADGGALAHYVAAP